MTYKIADVIFKLNTLYDFTHKLCKKYLYSGDKEAECVITTTKQDIDFERVNEPNSDGYLECLAVYRKICDYVFERGNGLVFHSSAVAVDGKCYLFTAPSGTGKSTHARLWKEYFGDRAKIINDDKPIIRLQEGKAYAYGTAWSGKHRIDSDDKAEIKAICVLEQAKENSIKELSQKEILPVILNQTVRPSEIGKMDVLLERISNLLGCVKTYKLGCNISLEAVKLAYERMSEK